LRLPLLHLPAVEFRPMLRLLLRLLLLHLQQVLHSQLIAASAEAFAAASAAAFCSGEIGRRVWLSTCTKMQGVGEHP
jgi:hypothetical protein